MEQNEKIELSYEMATAVLMAPNIYNFSELVRAGVKINWLNNLCF